VAALPEVLDRTCSSSDAIRLILAGLEGRALSPDPDPGALELVGWLELHLDDSPAMVITGLNEGILPGSVVGDPFLPDSLRRRLGLLSNQGRLGRDAYLLASHIASRRDLGLTLARVGPGLDPLRPSRLLLTGEGSRVARRLLHFLEADLPAPFGAVATPDLPVEPAVLTAPPERVLRFSKRSRWSVTDFAGLLGDPYVFVLRRVVGLREDHDLAREMNPAVFGDLVHTVLQHFGHGEMEDPSVSVEAAQTRMRDSLVRKARARFGTNSLPAVRIQLRHMEARLLAVAAWHAGAMADGWRVAAIEATPVGPDGERQDVPLKTPNGPVALRGRIDRVDVHPATGRWRIMDYKSSETGTDPIRSHLVGKREDLNWKDLQLPLYRHMLPHLKLEGNTPLPEDAFVSPQVEVGYVILPRTLDQAGWRPADFTVLELEDALDAAGAMVAMLDSGEVAFDRTRTERTLFRDDPLRALLGLAGLPPDDAGTPPGDGDEEGSE